MRANFKGYMLVSDIDGTLITDEFTIPKANIRAIEQFVDAGGIFTLATGRSMTSAQPYYEKVKTVGPVVVYNGAGLYDYQREELLWYRELSENTKKLFGQMVESCPDVGVEVHSVKELYILRDHARVRDHIQHESLPHSYAELEEILHKPWNKALFAAETDQLKKVEACFQQHAHEGAYLIWSSPIYLELLADGINKGEALKALAEENGISMENTFAIGDYYNDLEMLETAGISAAPQDAPEEIRKKADYTAVKCNEGAVADFISYLDHRIAER